MEEKNGTSVDEAKVEAQETDTVDETIDETEVGEFEEGEGVESQEDNNPPDPKPKKSQTKEESAYFARMRKENRELKERMAKLEEEKKQSEFNAKASRFSEDTLSELGIDKIETEDDMLLAESYKEALKKGSTNPIADAYKALRNKQSEQLREATAKKSAEEENKKKVSDDQIAFKKAYGIDTKQALQDERFKKMYGKFITYGNLTELYGMYQENVLKPEQAQRQIEEKAKDMGTVPSSNGSPISNDGGFNPFDLEGKDWLDYVAKLRNR